MEFFGSKVGVEFAKLCDDEDSNDRGMVASKSLGLLRNMAKYECNLMKLEFYVCNSGCLVFFVA